MKKFLLSSLAMLCACILPGQNIYKDVNNHYRANFYLNLDLDPGAQQVLRDINNLPTTPEQEDGFYERLTEEIDGKTKSDYNFGNRFFENEKKSYPAAMSTMINGYANNISNHVAQGVSYLMADDNQGGGMATYTEMVDLYPGFTIKNQVPKYFYFGKFNQDLSPAYMEQFRRAVYLWTHRWLEEGDASPLPNPIVGNFPAGITERSPFYRPNPVYDGDGPSWGPEDKNSWVDIRGTDNLRSMRETSIYLFSEEIGATSAANNELDNIINHVATLYNCGYSEWESDTYYPHVIAPYLNLFTYTKSPKAREIAKAGLDWYLVAGALKYYRGIQMPPTKRVYEERFIKSMCSEAGMIGYQYFGQVPGWSKRVDDHDPHITFLSDYRPPQAVYGIGTKDMQKHVEQINTKNHYGKFQVNQDEPEAREFIYFGENYQMASAAYYGANQDMTDNGMALHNSSNGADGLFVYRSGSGQIYSKKYGVQIGQYKNYRVHLQKASQTPFYILTASEHAGVQSPLVETDADGNTVLFFQFGNSWVSARLLNATYQASVPHTESTGAKYGAWWTTDNNGDPDVFVHQTAHASSNGYAGMIIEVGEPGTRPDQYNDFSEFVQAIKARTPDLSQFNNGIVEQTTRLNEFIRVQFNASNDMPVLYRNAQSPYDWQDENHNYDTYRAITPPFVDISSAQAINNSTGISIIMQAYDPELGPVNQAWESGKITIVSGQEGTASGYRFECSIDKNTGDVVWSEVPITDIKQRRGEVVKVEVWVDNTKLTTITQPAEIAALENGTYNFTWDNAKSGTNMVIKAKAWDAQGNTAWSTEKTVTVTNGDNTPPATPTYQTDDQQPGYVVTPLSSTEIKLDWYDNSEPDIYAYNVYRGVSPGFIPSPENLVGERVNGSVFVDQSLVSGQQYYFKLSALDSSLNESAPTPGIQASSMKVLAISALHDSYCSATSGEQGPNGSASELLIKEGYRVPVMMFDLSTLSGKAVVEAKLSIHAKNNGTDIPQVGVVEYPDQDWDEATIDYNNMVNYSGNYYRFASPLVSSSNINVTSGSYQEYLLDISAFARDQYLAGRKLSIVLSNRNHLTSVPCKVASREYGTTSYRPQLMITYIETSDATPPANEITGLTVASARADEIQLQWDAINSSDLYGYYVFRDTVAGFTANQENLVAYGLQNASYLDEGLEGNKTYYYKVSAKDLTGNETGLSNEVSAKTDQVISFDVLEDTYTDVFSPDMNFGGDNEIKVKRNGNQWIAYVKFDLGSFSGAISSAKLNLNARVFESPPNALDIGVFILPGDASSWSENTLTYNNRPTSPEDFNASTFIRDEGKLAGPLTSVSDWTYVWWEWDVTQKLRQHLINGNDSVTFLVASFDIDASMFFHSRESGNGATLQLAFQPGDEIPPVKPSGLNLINVDGTKINLAWSDNPEPDLAFYKLYRGTSDAFTIHDSLVVASNLQEPQVTNVVTSGNATYYYRITAVDISGNESVPSDPVPVFVPDVYELSPVADAYVRDGGYADDNFGTEPLLYVKRNDGGKRITYMRFDLSAVQGNAQSANLELYGGLGDAGSSNIPASVHEVPDNSWIEGDGSSGITYNTRPGYQGMPSATTIITDNNKRWYSWNLTDLLKKQLLEGETSISIAIENDYNSAPYTIFNARENGNARPKLTITTSNKDVSPTPVISLEPGTYKSGQQVSIVAAGADEIRYTLDGSNPDETSMLYTGDIMINETVTLKARSFTSGELPSLLVSGKYIIIEKVCPRPLSPDEKEITTDNAVLTWQSGTGTEPVLGYKVLFKDVGAADFDSLEGIGFLSNQYDLGASLAPFTTYEWNVVAVCADTTAPWAYSEPSISNQFTTFGTCDIDPVGLTVVDNSACKTILAWANNSQNNGYQVEYKLTSASEWEKAPTMVMDTIIQLYNLAPNSSFDWRVRSYCAGSGTYSNFVQSAFSTNTDAGCQDYPANNPYLARYPGNGPSHWTNNFRWTNIFDVTAFGAVEGGDIATNGQANYDAVMDAILAAEADGGGVVFFPAGTYYIDPGANSSGIRMTANVVLRGEKSIMANATESAFLPASKLVFPGYQFDDNGAGTPNNTAFKSIYSFDGADNIGVVDLNINRAHLYFRVPTGSVTGYTTPQAITAKENILVMGNKINNSARPFSIVPRGFQHQYQRFPNPFGANVTVWATKNVVVANNRLNDSITDNHTFNHYLVNNHLDTSQEFDLTDGSPDRRVTFSHTDQNGIIVNRNKGNYIHGATIEEEPMLFAEGIEIMHNWIFKTNRIGIFSAGKGMLIRGNEIYDQDNKKRYVSTNGYSSMANDQTYENRGIDWGGHDVVIDSNTVEVYQDNFENVFTGFTSNSIDGEGVLIQECCGGTTVDGITISFNSFSGDHPYIGLWKIKDINDATISSNDLGGASIVLSANKSNFKPYYWSINNTVIQDNHNIGPASNPLLSGIVVAASNGDSNLVIQDNTAALTETPGIIAPCFAEVNNNTGFTVEECYASPYPVINGFSPSAAKVGEVVTISGEGFSHVYKLTLNGDSIPGLNVLDEQTIEFTVPVGAVSGTISVYYNGATAPAAGLTPELKSAMATSLETFTVLSGIPTAEAPTFSPVPGDYSTAQIINLASITPGAEIYYTTDGVTDPLDSAKYLYSSPFVISEGTTIIARTYAAGHDSSEMVAATYTITPPGQVSDPVFDPVAGTYNGPLTVSISTSTADDTIYYTTDGSEPVEDINLMYSGAFDLTANTTVKARAFKSGMVPSNIISVPYIVNMPLDQVEAPVFSKASGQYNDSVVVEISSATPGATIYYTLDGTNPVPGTSMEYAGGIVLKEDVEINAIATKTGMENSIIRTAIYTILTAGIDLDASNIRMYPVPATNYLIIENVPGQVSGIRIIDALGRLRLTENVTTKVLMINMQDLEPGMYTIQLTGNKTITRTMIKN